MADRKEEKGNPRDSTEKKFFDKFIHSEIYIYALLFTETELRDVNENTRFIQIE